MASTSEIVPSACDCDDVFSALDLSGIITGAESPPASIIDPVNGAEGPSTFHLTGSPGIINCGGVRPHLAAA